MTLGLMNIFYDESSYLKEWLEYHTLLGVDHFYLTNNGSTDNFYEIVYPYLKKGTVTLLDVYNHGLGAPKCFIPHNMQLKLVETDWVGMCDIDEFLVPVNPKETIKDILKDFDKSNYAGIAVCWDTFNANGHIDKPTAPVIESYTKKVPVQMPPFQPHHKMIYRPARVCPRVGNPHWINPLPGYIVVDELHRPVYSYYTQTQTISRIKQNHYWCKSREEWLNKCDKGLNDIPGCPKRNISDFDEFNSRPCEEDTAILRFLPQLKERLK